MFTVIRILGPDPTPNELAAEIGARVPGIHQKIDRRGRLVIDLSTAADWSQHLQEVRTRLELFVDCIDDLSEVDAVVDASLDAPVGEGWVRAYRFDSEFIEFLNKHGIELEITVYPPLEEQEN